MKTIGRVFSHNSLRTDKSETNKSVRASRPLQVDTYRKLVQLVAKIAYRNRGYDLFFRGQNKEYLNSKDQTSLLPSLFRKYHPDLLKVEKLKQFENVLQEREFKFEHDETFNQFNEVKWAILQHYEVCDTPLLDLTSSLRVACSFALEKATNGGVLYVLGFPLVNGSISFYVDEELVNVKLLGICPPQALRPHFQEGFLAGTFPTLTQKGSMFESHYDVERLDFGKRLIAKFQLPSTGFWDDEFTPIPHDALFPEGDEVAGITNKIKSFYSDDWEK